MKPHLWLIQFIGLIVPRRLRADWRQEWDAELRYREGLLADWNKLDWRTKLDLLWRSLGAFRDALWLQQLRWDDEMFQDLRYALRMLVKNPSFTLVAVFTLALGICGVTTQFSVVDAALLRGLPFPEPERLVRLTMRNPSWAPEREFSLSAADVLEVAPKQQSFEGLAQYLFAGSFIVLRQMLVESLVLAALGGAAGALLARWAIGLFAGVMGTLPTQALPSWMLFKIDGRVLGFTADHGGRLPIQHLRSSPQFTHAAFTDRRNMMTNDTFHGQIEGRTYARPEDRLESWLEFVSDGYFATLGLSPIAGREFEPSDTGDRQFVVLVNESFARKHFGSESPLGHRLRAKEGDTWRTIIGVAPDTMMQGPLEQQRDGSAIFVPIEALPLGYLTLVVRGHEPASRLTQALRRELAKVEPNLAIYIVETPKNHLKNALAQGRTVASLFSIFGVVSVLLAAVGLYGVMSFAVSRRTQEFGIRMALGAQRRDIVRMVMAQGGRQLALGAALGIGLALALVQLGGAAVASFLYRVNPRDPLVYVGVVLLLAVATVMACIFPARRATKADPMVALRHE